MNTAKGLCVWALVHSPLQTPGLPHGTIPHPCRMTLQGHPHGSAHIQCPTAHTRTHKHSGECKCTHSTASSSEVRLSRAADPIQGPESHSLDPKLLTQFLVGLGMGSATPAWLLCSFTPCSQIRDNHSYLRLNSSVLLPEEFVTGPNFKLPSKWTPLCNKLEYFPSL